MLLIIIFILSGNNFYCDGECFGSAHTLSTSQDLKSSNFDDVKTIIFDEFIIEPRSEKILSSKRSFCFLEPY